MNKKLGGPMGEEELVGNTADQKNWRGIAIALVVIVVVCAFIITAIVLMTPASGELHLGSPFTLHDFFDESLKPKDFPVQWAKGDKFYYRNEEGSLLEFNSDSNSTTLIMDNVTFRNLDTGHYTVSPDRQYVMLKHDIIPIFRHSTLASYSLYDTNIKSLKKLVGPYGTNFQYVQWSPKHGHSLVFVQENNIYYKPNVEDDKADPITLTHTGMPGIIYNGIPDWIYEEEIFSTDHALWWSPDGTYLCYAIFNNTMVHKYYYPVYSDYNHPYAQVVTIPYPKPGFPNPTISLQIVKMGVWSKVTIEPPNEFLNKEHYVTKVLWKDKENVWVCWLNRAQNVSVMTICSATTGKCQKSLREEGHGGWFKLQADPMFTSDVNKYIMILSQKHTELGYFKHIAIIDNTKPIDDRKYFLMYTKWEVTDLLGYNEEDKIVYFIATGGDPRRRHLYSVAMDKTLKCLTCDLDEKCQYVNAQFSPSMKYYILGCLGPTVPYYSLRAVGEKEEITRLENNTAVGNRIAKMALPRMENFQIELDNGEKLWGRLLLPPKLNKEETLLYPLVMHVYGSPGTQKVTEKFGTGWETYLTSSKDFIYALVDGRGSGGRGDRFLHEIYRHLGKKEVEDAITAGRHYSTLSYVDTNKMAIWGWSYGGFLALSALGRGTGIFPCGISVAPVTDWIYYDSVYTERFMGMPTGDDNLQAYKESNVSNFAENFKKTKLLLVHGTGDDNVHFQHTAQLMKTLNEHNTYYRTQIYPDKHHGLLGGNTRRHLFETLEDFLDECFTGVSTKFGNVGLIPVEE